VNYLKDTFETPAGEIAKDCAKHLSQPKRCVELVAG
jgi:hypothetical protein